MSEKVKRWATVFFLVLFFALWGWFVFTEADEITTNNKTVPMIVRVVDVAAVHPVVAPKAPAVPRVVKPSRSRPTTGKPVYLRYARSEVSRSRWHSSEYSCLVKLWERESHWNPKAKNPTSSASGIPQILGLKTPIPKNQIDSGLKYIKHRYGTPCKALQHSYRTGWY
jgi:hypothetical protein